jgi:CDP-glycerol glycerophosphotransferase
MAPIGKRTVPTSMFTHNQPFADLYTSRVYRTLRVQRLFRRELVERHHLRLPEILLGEDQSFAALAYIHARVISVVADYDCYFLRARDGRNLTVRFADSVRWTANLESLIPLVAAHVPAGRRRDVLMRKHFKDAMRQTFGGHFLKHDRQIQADVVGRIAKLMDEYYTPRVAAGLPALARLTFALAAAGNVDAIVDVLRSRGKDIGSDVVEGGRVYAPLPHFRDPELLLTDALFDVTTERKVRNQAGERTKQPSVSARRLWRRCRGYVRDRRYLGHLRHREYLGRRFLRRRR